MSGRRSWGDVQEAARDLLPVEWRALAILARLPLLWPEALGALSGQLARASIYRHVSRLTTAGLVAGCRTSAWPFRSGRPLRLLYLTDAGVAALALASLEEPNAAARILVRRGRLSGAALRRALPGISQLVAAYTMLLWLAQSRPGTPLVLGWERPWRRRLVPPAARHPVTATLPAAVLLGWPGEAGSAGTLERRLLLPDLGTAPVAAYRSVLSRLRALRTAPTTSLPAARDEAELVIATTDEQRGSAWRRLLDEIASDAMALPLLAQIRTWAGIDLTCPTTGRGRNSRQRCRVCWEPVRLRPRQHDGLTRAIPRQVGLLEGAGDDHGTGTSSWRATRLTATDRMLLDVVGRHPFLAAEDLADLLGWTHAWTRRRMMRLVTAGWLQWLGAGEIGDLTDASGLLELTRTGVALVAAQQGLTVSTGVQFNGLAGGGPTQPRGTSLARARAILLRHLAHTRGTDDFFVRLAQTARTFVGAPPDAALVAWRNAVACSRGHVRPDGYGIYREHGRRYGFFLEYDRGTQDAGAYRRKLAAFYAYRDSGRFTQEYSGFPTILLVTSDTDTEARIAGYARAAAVGRGEPLPLLLTARWCFHGDGQRAPDPAGLLGPIWRDAFSTSRRRWPNALLPVCSNNLHQKGVL